MKHVVDMSPKSSRIIRQIPRNAQLELARTKAISFQILKTDGNQ